jgi:hypothetical protein
MTARNDAPRTPRRTGAIVVRLLVGAIGLLALGGPSPGHVGSCDGSAELAAPGAFCEQYRTWFCVRELQGERINEAEYTNCANGIPTFCAAFSFGMCRPTQRRADSCIAAMRDPGRVSTPSSMIPECNFCDSGGI